MRILTLDDDKNQDGAIVYLTRQEALQLGRYLEELLSEAPERNHRDIYDDTYQKKLTVCLYDPAHPREYGFDDRSVRLIEHNL